MTPDATINKVYRSPDGRRVGIILLEDDGIENQVIAWVSRETFESRIARQAVRWHYDSRNRRAVADAVDGTGPGPIGLVDLVKGPPPSGQAWQPRDGDWLNATDDNLVLRPVGPPTA